MTVSANSKNIYRQLDTRTDKYMERQTDTKIDRQTDIHTYIQRYREKHTVQTCVQTVDLTLPGAVAIMISALLISDYKHHTTAHYYAH